MILVFTSIMGIVYYAVLENGSDQLGWGRILFKCASIHSLNEKGFLIFHRMIKIPWFQED